MPRALRFADDVAHLAPADRVERRGRLVEEDEGGVVEQRLGQADALEHPLRVACGAGRRPAPASPTSSSSSGMRRRRTARGQAGRARPWKSRNSTPRSHSWKRNCSGRKPMRRLASIAPSGWPSRRAVARGGEGQAEQHLHGCALARAIRPEKAEDLAFRHARSSGPPRRPSSRRLSAARGSRSPVAAHWWPRGRSSHYWCSSSLHPAKHTAPSCCVTRMAHTWLRPARQHARQKWRASGEPLTLRDREGKGREEVNAHW